MTKEKGPTRAQLSRTIERKDMRIKYLEAELARFNRGDHVRKEGEHWYELTDYLDPSQIRQLPSSPLGPTFVMGMLGEMLVLEYPANAPQKDVQAFMKILREQGCPPTLAIAAGVRFLRLRTVDEETEAKIDAEVLDERTKREAAERAEGAGSSGSELHGDGVGRGGSDAGEDPRGGGDRDGPGAGVGETVVGG